MLGGVRLEWTESELLASHEVAEPLVAGGVRCHGGFLADGTYVPPRTLNRVPAIEAWQAHHRATFGTELLEAPLSAWPENYPNVAQARLLLKHGVREPIVAILTRIGTVEGFGAMIRQVPVPDWRTVLAEDVRGTATAHLGRGLFEAHARDEAGFGAEGGHRQMWFAARDIAFENPVTEDETERMLQRMGIVAPGGTAGPLAAPPRLLPADIPVEVEALIERMVRLLLIEVSAFHTFAWAEELLADDRLVAGEGEAARLVACVRADETPHVEYLRTALTEMRDRTFVGESGRTYPGTEVVGRLFERAMADSLGPRRRMLVEQTDAEVARAVAGRPDGDELFAEFKRLAPAA
jgi:hypothetical protein